MGIGNGLCVSAIPLLNPCAVNNTVSVLFKSLIFVDTDTQDGTLFPFPLVYLTYDLLIFRLH